MYALYFKNGFENFTVTAFSKIVEDSSKRFLDVPNSQRSCCVMLSISGNPYLLSDGHGDKYSVDHS